MMLPVGQVSSIISSVMFSSFSIIQEDKELIKLIYLKISRSIAFVTFPMMGILIVVAEPFVKVVLGNEWLPIVFILQILAIVGALQSLGTLVGNIFMSQGAMKVYFFLNLFSSIIIVTAFIIGVFFSIEWVAIAYLIAVCIIIIPQCHFAGNLIHCTVV
jgi:PST family polysaccharide transporter